MDTSEVEQKIDVILPANEGQKEVVKSEEAVTVFVPHVAQSGETITAFVPQSEH